MNFHTSALLLFIFNSFFLTQSVSFNRIESGICKDGTREVNCKVDPCSTARCSSGICVSNYCGGCNAICQCEGDNDCKSNEWCRVNKPQQSALNWNLNEQPTHRLNHKVHRRNFNPNGVENFEAIPVVTEQSKSCVPFAEEGHYCGGFVMASHLEKCNPDSRCVYYPSRVSDQHGVCYFNCNPETNPCPDHQYCSEDGSCINHGQCTKVVDCLLPQNQFFSIQCIGDMNCVSVPTEDIPANRNPFETAALLLPFKQRVHQKQCAKTCGHQSCQNDWDCPIEFRCDPQQHICRYIPEIIM